MMMDNKLKKSLTIYGVEKKSFLYRLIQITPFFMLIMGILNLYTSSKLGKYTNSDIFDLFSLWTGGFDSEKNYLGFTLKALERFETAIFLFGLAIVIGVFSYKAYIQRTMNRKMVAILKKHNEWDRV